MMGGKRTVYSIPIIINAMNLMNPMNPMNPMNLMNPIGRDAMHCVST